MKITPNLGNGMRAAYILIGLGLVLSPLVWAAPAWATITLPIVGVVSMVEGALGY